MFSKSTPSDAESTYSVSSMATTLKGTEAPSSKKWFTSSKTLNQDHTATPKSSSTKEKALHNEAIATYLALR